MFCFYGFVSKNSLLQVAKWSDYAWQELVFTAKTTQKQNEYLADLAMQTKRRSPDGTAKRCALANSLANSLPKRQLQLGIGGGFFFLL